MAFSFNEKIITYSDLGFGPGNSITRIPAIRNINSLRNISINNDEHFDGEEEVKSESIK